MFDTVLNTLLGFRLNISLNLTENALLLVEDNLNFFQNLNFQISSGR